MLAELALWEGDGADPCWLVVLPNQRCFLQFSGEGRGVHGPAT